MNATMTVNFYVQVDARMTEDQWREAHAIAGRHLPGRFKEWVGEHAEDHGTAGFGFTPIDANRNLHLVEFLLGLGKPFKVTETTTTHYGGATTHA
jgi:hypothetical protein